MGNNEADSSQIAPEQIVLKIRDGERQAESILVQKYWRGIKFLLLKRCQSHELAEDLTQDTFIIAIHRIRQGEVKEPKALSGFIRQIGIHLLIAHYRKEARRDTECDTDIVIQNADKSPTINEQLEAAQIKQIVQQLIDEMSVDRDKELLRRYFLFEQDKQAICQFLDLSPDQFDKVLYRARNRLKSKIEAALQESQQSLVSNMPMLVVLTSLLTLIEISESPNSFDENENQVRETILSYHLTNERTLFISEAKRHWPIENLKRCA